MAGFAVTTEDFGGGISSLHGTAHGLQQRRLSVGHVPIVLVIEVRRQFKHDVEVAEPLDRGVSTVRTDVKAVRSL